MPGMYMNSDFDLAGFAVGIAERSQIDRVHLVKEGQILLAFPSSGIHSNGYSLVRKIFFDKLNLNFDTQLEGQTLIEVLLEPTKIYVKEFKINRDRIVALAHITGGGIVENLPRVLPQGITAVVDKSKIQIPSIFKFISKYVDEVEMYRTFNMGVRNGLYS